MKGWAGRPALHQQGLDYAVMVLGHAPPERGFLLLPGRTHGFRSGADLHHQNLEAGGEAEGHTPRRSDGIAGKKTAKIDDVENVGEVLSIDLKPRSHMVRFVNFRAGRGIDLERRENASAGKVDAIHDGLSVCLGWSARSVDALFRS